MYLEDQNIRNTQQLASRIHVYVVVFVLQFLELPELSFHRRVFFWWTDEVKSCMSNSHCQIVLLCPAIFGWFYVASCLSKLNSERKNPPRVWNVQLFSPQQNKNSCCWIDEFSYVHILGGLRAFKVFDPWPPLFYITPVWINAWYTGCFVCSYSIYIVATLWL